MHKVCKSKYRHVKLYQLIILNYRMVGLMAVYTMYSINSS